MFMVAMTPSKLVCAIALMTILCKCSCDSATTSLCNATILEVSPPVHGSLKKEGGLPMNRLTTNRTRLHDWVSKRAVFVLENNDASSIGTPPMSSPCGAWANKEENVIVLAHASEPWLLDVLGGECKQGKRDSPIRTCFEPLTEVLANISTEAVEKLWAESTVIAAVVNPFIRAARAYLRVIGGWAHHKGGCVPLGFRDFARDPPSLALQGGLLRCGKPHEVQKGRRHNNDTVARVVPDVVKDMTLLEPVSNCLTTSAGGWATNYLIRADAEHVLPDLRAAVALCKERKTATDGAAGLELDENAVPNQLKLGRDRAQLASLYDECGAECPTLVANFYAQDVRTLGYMC